MAFYRYQHFRVKPGDPAWRAVAHQAYVSREHMYCDCTRNGADAPMHVAQGHGTYVVKRVPLTGAHHSAACKHYQEPDGISGRAYSAAAVRDELRAQKTYLSVDVSLSPRACRGFDDDSERDPAKLSLRAFAHYLFEEAGLNRWSPRIFRKRSWSVVRRELLDAAAKMIVKRRALLDVLYIPEAFDANRRGEIKQRRNKRLRTLKLPEARILLIAEWERAERTPLGYFVTLAHMPDLPVLIEQKLWDRVTGQSLNRSASETGQVFDSAHQLLVGTIGRTPDGGLQLHAGTLITTTSEWLPVDHCDEHKLITDLVARRRRFTKCLSYDLNWRQQPCASAVLNDTSPRATVIYVARTGMDPAFNKTLAALAESSGMPSIRWVADWLESPAPAGQPLPARSDPRAYHRVSTASLPQPDFSAV